MNAPRQVPGSPPRGRILVIRGGAIGDFILTLPVLAALRQQFPGAHLEVLGYPHIVQLALAGGLVDQRGIDRSRAMAGFFARGRRIVGKTWRIISPSSTSSSPTFTTRMGSSETNVARMFACPVHRGSRIGPDESAAIQASKVYLKPLERLAIFGADPVPRLKIDRPTGRRGVIAMHPGSGSERKNWPEPRWTELVRQIIDRTDYDLLLVGGEAEGDRLQRLAAALPPARARVALSMPLAELAAIMETLRRIFGP